MNVKKLVIHRKPKFPSALLPYWIVIRISKDAFMNKYGLYDDVSCTLDPLGHPLPRMEFRPQEWGIPLGNGKTLELEIDSCTNSVFAMTTEGLLSNEILLPPQFTYCQITVATKGGWKTPSHPMLTLDVVQI